jgi:N-acetylglucosaminyl-diphospho-decaprenol L-rhamnosyltransferase
VSINSRVWIIIVNYRTAALVLNCLRLLSSQVDALSGGRVLVIDNASGDGSLAALADVIDCEGWREWADVVPLDRNGGFAFGNNAGIRVAQASPIGCDYLYLLNPDTLVRPNAINALINFMSIHPEVGIAGSHIENSEGGEECSAHRFHSPLGELAEGSRLGLLDRLLENHLVTPPLRNDAHLCDWVSGASMMVRREVVEDIGFLDEGYFLYYEEEDFCRRAVLAGWDIYYVPDSKIMHIEGAATGIQQAAKRRPAYWYNSRRRYFTKNYGVAGLVLTDLLWTLGRVSYLARRAVGLGAQSETRDPKWFMLDILWGDLRAILNGQAWRIKKDMS